MESFPKKMQRPRELLTKPSVKQPVVNMSINEELPPAPSSRTLTGKVFRSGFYWPTVLQDAAAIVQSCDACQFRAKQIHQPTQGLQTIPLSWPFAVWGLPLPLRRRRQIHQVD